MLATVAPHRQKPSAKQGNPKALSSPRAHVSSHHPLVTTLWVTSQNTCENYVSIFFFEEDKS